jgi:hypothetical protein
LCVSYTSNVNFKKGREINNKTIAEGEVKNTAEWAKEARQACMCHYVIPLI